MDSRIVAEYVVYGRDIGEIKDRAKMIGRRFFGSLVPTYTFRCEQLPVMEELYKADVEACWDPEIHSTS